MATNHCFIGYLGTSDGLDRIAVNQLTGGVYLCLWERLSRKRSFAFRKPDRLCRLSMQSSRHFSGRSRSSKHNSGSGSRRRAHNHLHKHMKKEKRAVQRIVKTEVNTGKFRESAFVHPPLHLHRIKGDQRSAAVLQPLQTRRPPTTTQDERVSTRSTPSDNLPCCDLRPYFHTNFFLIRGDKYRVDISNSCCVASLHGFV